MIFMEFDTKKLIKEKTRYAYGLLDVLEYRLAEIRKDLDKIETDIDEVSVIVQKLFITIEEVKYILNSHDNQLL